MVGIAFFTAGWRFLTTEEQIGKKWRQRNGRKPTQHQRNKQYREQGSTVFTRDKPRLEIEFTSST
ncbi:Uncharacterised protein [Vibrio cholerae]|nr:Uncharacterised protein [Vibrio cholerae]